ncbi:MAG: methyltransferase [bacterium]|nr:methyltransferase [bacterium]
MRRGNVFIYCLVFLFILAGLFYQEGFARVKQENSGLDLKVKKFLREHRNQWYRMNVPGSDGKVLYDLIIKHNYKKALEIGTSTGHSAIWTAWALSKTGGKLITIEIDEPTYNEALKNFKEAGLSDYIDARLADAHQLVPKLKGPFDFVFCDADKGWYKNYFTAVMPKLTVGGCYTAHNVSMRGGRRGGRGGRGRRSRGGTGEFLEYVKRLPNFETTIVNSSFAGISVSYKKAEK